MIKGKFPQVAGPIRPHNLVSFRLTDLVSLRHMLVHGFAHDIQVAVFKFGFRVTKKGLAVLVIDRQWFLLLTGSGVAGDQDLNFKKPILAATNNIGNTDNYPQKFGWKGIAQH